MPSYKERRKDCKFYVEEGMRKLGWKTNDAYQDVYAKKECCVIYSGIHTQLETQMSYHPTIDIKLIFDLEDNNDMFIVNDEILDYITKYVEDSNAMYCGTFFCRDTDFIPTGGRSYRVEMIFNYHHERDWITEF